MAGLLARLREIIQEASAWLMGGKCLPRMIEKGAIAGFL